VVTPAQLKVIIEKVAVGSATDEEVEILQRAFDGSEPLSLQVGEHIVNIGQGKDIHIGNKVIHQGADAESIKKVLLEVLQQQNQKRPEYNARKALFHKVKQYWIKEVLEKSLHFQSFIEIHSQKQSDAVQHPYSNHQEYDDEPQQALSTNITDVFVQMEVGQTLLILGEPGAGKTTILLKLLEKIIEEIKDDFTKEIPVVFNLSSWRNKQNDFNDWLAQELNKKYQVSRVFAEKLVKNQQLILLLDGLDEVKEAHRIDCIKKINEFIINHGETVIVLCSRTKEYKEIAKRLTLQRAICLLPLTPEQIDWYLSAAGEQLEDLKMLLREDDALQELAKVPLILSIVIQAYRITPIENFPNIGSLEERKKQLRKQLFDKYIERMFQRRLDIQEADKIYTEKRTKSWLKWLAKKMSDNESIFQIEQIQPHWLPSETDKNIYHIVVGLIVGLILGLAAGLYFIYYHQLIQIQNIYNETNISLIALTSGILSGLISGVIAGLLCVLPNRHIGGMLSGIIFALTISIVIGLIDNKMLIIYIFPIFLCAIIGGAGFRLIGTKIKPVDFIKPEAGKIRKYAIIGLILGLLYDLIRFLIVSQIYGTWNLVIILSKSYGAKGYSYLIYELLVFVIFGGIYGGFRIQEKVVNSEEVRPNQGIRRSRKYALISLAILMPAAALIGWVIDSVRNPFFLGCIGLTLGLIGGLVAGEGSGIVCIQHFTLRVILWYKGYIPWNYARFLNYASERIFLRKTGGSYIFIHRMLLEHFAQMQLD